MTTTLAVNVFSFFLITFGHVLMPMVLLISSLLWGRFQWSFSSIRLPFSASHAGIALRMSKEIYSKKKFSKGQKRKTVWTLSGFEKVMYYISNLFWGITIWGNLVVINLWMRLLKERIVEHPDYQSFCCAVFLSLPMPFRERAADRGSRSSGSSSGSSWSSSSSSWSSSDSFGGGGGGSFGGGGSSSSW
ncbi:MAG: hypothetical protein R3C61_26995 [Bacteroidia bacterium]